MNPILGYLNVFLMFFGASAITLYSTWLLLHRLRHGEQDSKSFFTWLKHIFEAVMGL